MGDAPRGWIHRLLHACLIAWPAGDRATLGADLVDTARTLLEEPGNTSATQVLAEAWGILHGGCVRRGQVWRGGLSRWLMDWTDDVRFSLRTLRRRPGFLVVAVMTLAIGIGANAAVFSLVDGVLFERLPYEDPDALALVWNSVPGSDERIPVSGPDVAALGARASSFVGLAFSLRGADGSLQTAAGDAAHHVRISSVTPDFFSVLGVEPALGRSFAVQRASGSNQSGATVMLSEGAWRRAFAADPAVIGRDVWVNGTSVTVVGVMPADFRIVLPPDAGVQADADIWLPLQTSLNDLRRQGGRLLDRDSDNTGTVIARLAPGTSLSAARAEVAGIAADLRALVPAYEAAGLDLEVRLLRADATAHARPLLLALLVGSTVLLLVACLNVATLLVARGVGRRQEFSVRAALGGGRARLLRQLTTEGAVLAAIGLVVAVAFAHVGIGLLGPLLPSALAPAGGLDLDGRSFAAMTLVAAAATVAFGLLPGLHGSALGAGASLRSGQSTGSSGQSRTRAALVVLQVGLAVVLTLGAGLLLRTVGALEAVRPGFDASSAFSFRVSMRVPDRYRSPGHRAELMDDIEARIGPLPGVAAVGRVGVLPLTGDRWTQPFGLPGQSEPEWQENRADFRSVSSGYFEAMGTRLLEGRAFTQEEDLREVERVVVIDRTLAERIAPFGSAVGAAIGIPLDGDAVEARVVGVVEHVRHDRLDADGLGAIYVPYRQEASRDVTFAVRTLGAPTDVVDRTVELVRSLDPQLPVYDVGLLSDNLLREVAPRRFGFTLLLAFAGLALLCSAVGLYGVMSFDVGRRRREIGIRMAVGARRSSVVGAFLRRGLRLGAVGALAGIVFAALLSRTFGNLLFGVSPADPVIWSSVLAGVLLLALLASGLPALRASRVSPTDALRAG